jgi:alkanesulfonate monooxygenase SsuD/methylene tetrahydromethanopterin reductase-like flavin-dependent oxidoreductase (luciferase family)/hemerythrin-like domain-containing protein
MTDYGHDLLFGSFITPAAGQAEAVVALSRIAEREGLDLVTYQDHPYQAGFLDTWTLMSYVAAATETIRISANVINLPLRPPVVLARSAASLDLLSGGRIELGLGAGAFWDAIAAVGGPRRTPAESVEALDEAITIIREVWDAAKRGGVRVDGKHYQVAGAKRGPAPAHDIGIWLGAYKPRMLRLVGRAADGWLPSLYGLKGGLAELDADNKIIDEAAEEAGRAPGAVRRLLNIGPDHAEPEELARFALEHGISTFILAADDSAAIQRFGSEIAPAVRELVRRERSGTRTEKAVAPSEPALAAQPDAEAAGSRERSNARLAGLRPTPRPESLRAERTLWDEEERPVAPPAPADYEYAPHGREIGQHLIDVHGMLRDELQRIHDVIAQVKSGALSVAGARSALNETALRQNNWELSAFCATYCTRITQHHGLEDAQIFPHLKRSDPDLVPVIDRLQEEHVVIHEVIEGVDRALVDLVRTDGDFTALQKAMDELSDALLSHLSYEEEQLVEPLARFGFYPGQV